MSVDGILPNWSAYISIGCERPLHVPEFGLGNMNSVVDSCCLNVFWCGGDSKGCIARGCMASGAN